MAKKRKGRYRNVKPVAGTANHTIEYKKPADDVVKTETDNDGNSSIKVEEGEGFGGSQKITGVARHSFFELGQISGHLFEGTDSYNKDILNITYANRMPDMTQYNFMTNEFDVDYDGFSNNVNDIGAEILNNIINKSYVYEQDIANREELVTFESATEWDKSVIPEWERQSKPIDSYEEDYFQHIVNWPETHTLNERKVGGFLKASAEIVVQACDPQNGIPQITQTKYYAKKYETMLTGVDYTLTTTETDIKLITDTPGEYDTDSITLDSTGRINEASVRDKLGDPRIYHGGTDSNKIFFNYVPVVASTTTNVSHYFDDVKNTGKKTVDSGDNKKFTILPSSGETQTVGGTSYPVMGRLYVPTGLSEDNIDVVVLFHGTLPLSGGTTLDYAANNMMTTFLDTLNVKDKIIFSAAYPQDHVSKTRQYNLPGVGSEEADFLMGDNLPYARAAVRWVKRSLNEFMSKNNISKTIGDVYLFGHSQGGKLVAEINTIDGGIAGVVSDSPGPIQFDTRCSGGGSNLPYSCSKVAAIHGAATEGGEPYLSMGLSTYTSTHKAPILFTQALDDPSGGGNQAAWLQTYVDAVQAIDSNASATLVTVPTGGHEAYADSAGFALQDPIRSFIKSNAGELGILQSSTGVTSSNTAITVEARSTDDPGSRKPSSKAKHYRVVLNSDTIVDESNIKIIINSNKTASGVSTKIYYEKIKLLGDNEFKVWFETEDGTITYVRDWSIVIGDNSENRTNEVITIGDTVNGATITNVCNYIVEIALKRYAADHSKKNTESKNNLSQSEFISKTGGTAEDYKATMAWIRLEDVSGITKNMRVRGYGVKNQSVITGVDESKNIIYINSRIKQRKLKLLKILENETNAVGKHTMCYAEISGGSNFAADTNYTVTRNSAPSGAPTITICVRAGKGIKKRAGIVGTYFSSRNKEVEYLPLFYGSDANCEPEVIQDEYGDYTLGTITWNDNTKDESNFYLTKPADELGYRIASIWTSFTLAPIERALYIKFIEDYKSYDTTLEYDLNGKPIFLSTNPLFKIYNDMREYVELNLAGKKSADVSDDVCRNPIRLEYTLIYDPYIQDYDIKTATGTIETSLNGDVCVRNLPKKSIDVDSPQDMQEKFAQELPTTLMTEDYYKRFMGDDDSLMKNIQKASNTMRKAVPKKTEIDNRPATIEGTDESGITWVKDNYKDLPPATDRTRFLLNDLTIASEAAINPIYDLDPVTTVNHPRMMIVADPKYTVTGPTTFATTVTGDSEPAGVTGSVSVNIDVTYNEDSDGHIETITAVADVNDGTSLTESLLQCPPVGTCVSWSGWSKAMGELDQSDNFYYGKNVGKYHESTHWELPEALRDLEFKDAENDKEDPPGGDDDVEKGTTFNLDTNESVYVECHPQQIWKPNINYQRDFYKMFYFRVKEVADLIGETVENGGNPFMDEPVTAKIKSIIKENDTTITVDSTSNFLSSGYLVIPRYYKKIVSTETGYNKVYHTYAGEEYIYYKSKSATQFLNCERGVFNSGGSYSIDMSVKEIEIGVRYKIKTLGNTNWFAIGGNKNPKVGDVFFAKDEGKGSGEVTLFGSTGDVTPDEELLPGIDGTPKIAVVSSYENGFTVSQYWNYTVKH